MERSCADACGNLRCVGNPNAFLVLKEHQDEPGFLGIQSKYGAFHKLARNTQPL
jgi:hypothetical protein